MTSDLVPTNRPQRSGKVKDVLIAVLALCLCLSLAALIRETSQQQESSRMYSAEALKLEELQKSDAQALSEKAESEKALRRAQITMKAGAEAQNIAFKLRQSTATARSH